MKRSERKTMSGSEMASNHPLSALEMAVRCAARPVAACLLHRLQRGPSSTSRLKSYQGYLQFQD
jgi:hypothetical protein